MKQILLILNLMIVCNSVKSQNWIDTSLYPFKSNFLATEDGKIHYVDQGKGDVILFVHGTPTWSFLYRDHIKELSKSFPRKTERYGLLNIGKSLIGSSDWYEGLWVNAEVIKNKPVLILWGEKDDFIKRNNLEKWQHFLSNEKTHLFEAGHFVQEEKTDKSIEVIRQWLSTDNQKLQSSWDKSIVC